MFIKLKNHLLNKDDIGWVQYKPATGDEKSVLLVHMSGASVIQVTFKGDEADVMWKELCKGSTELETRRS
jgi:hypothetical protein